MLADGSPELGGRPLPSVPIIGVGHSLGACLTVVHQARHRCYDAVALLGFTHGQKEVSVTAVGAVEREPADDDATLRKTATEQARAFFGDTWDDIYGSAPREPNHAWLHEPDVPAAVIAADDAKAARWPRQPYVEALLAGHSARFAAQLDCNVFIGFGDHDVHLFRARPDVLGRATRSAARPRATSSDVVERRVAADAASRPAASARRSAPCGAAARCAGGRAGSRAAPCAGSRPRRRARRRAPRRRPRRAAGRVVVDDDRGAEALELVAGELVVAGARVEALRRRAARRGRPPGPCTLCSSP